MFSWSKSNRKKPENPEDLKKSFQDYLNGYFNSFDYYPACTRNLFAHNDAYALWSDFMKVADDFSMATDEMITNPEQYLAAGANSSDAYKKRKQEADQKAIQQAIEVAQGLGNASKPKPT